MSNRDRPSNVDIDNIRSPKIDAIKQATERVSNWLHNDLREIIRPLQNLHTLPDDIGDLKHRLVEQFRRLFVGQITAEMKSREANIRVAKRKADLVETHVDRKKEQLTQSQERVRSRFENLAASVSRDHQSDLERLDDHAYRITDSIYPDQIQERFSYESPVFWTSLASHSAVSAAARTQCLLEGAEQAEDQVANFIDARESFHDSLRRLASPDATEGRYELPYWFVEAEDPDTGEMIVDIVFPWDLCDTDSPVSPEQEGALRQAARHQLNGDSATRSLTSDERDLVKSRVADSLADSDHASLDALTGDGGDWPRLVHVE